MSTTTAKPRSRPIGPAGGGPSGWGDGGGRGNFHPPLTTAAYRMGMLFALAGIGMLFVALTSAYVVRHGLDPDWRAIRMPAILWVNTAVLLVSSATIELARRTTRLRQQWLALTLALGLAFLCGQLMAWRQLSDAGVYLSTNPHSSFFYLLTGLHGMHLLGGIAALSYVVLSGLDSVRPGRAVEVISIYWHFMDALWVYLFLLLFA